ncbi:MAG: hypothetical protein AB2992_00135 [Candidatus Symbiodolus clandestinus]
MSNTISSSMKALLIDRVKNLSPIKGVTSRSRRVIYQCKNLFVRVSFNIKNSVKKLLLKQRKINVAHYAAMHANISILRHEIKELKRSLPIHLNDLKNKISHEIDSKLIVENKNTFNLLHDKLNEISAGMHAQNDKTNNLTNDIKNIFSVYKKIAVKYFYRPDVNVQATSEKSASQLLQLTNNSPRVPSDSQLRELTVGPQLPQLESGSQLKQLTAGLQLPQLESGSQLKQLTAGPQLPQLESGPQSLQLTEDPELVKIKIDAELGAHLPNYSDSEAEIAADQQRRHVRAEAKVNADLGQQLPNYGDSEVEIAANQQSHSVQAEARVNAELGRQLPNYDGNEIARATTAIISDLEGTDLSPEMTPAKKLSALQEAGRKVMQDPKSSLAARTVAFHSIAQAQRELKFSKKRIYRKN